VAISQTVAEIWRYFDFSAVRHLGFVKRMLRALTKGILVVFITAKFG